jgi:hypothetical protein
MELTKSSQNTVQSNGLSLAVFVDIDGTVKLKDIRGNIQPLSDFLSQIIYLLGEGNSIRPVNGKNEASGVLSAVLSGDYNTARGVNTCVVGGEANTTSNSHSFVGAGKNNQSNGDFSSILGGKNNDVKECRNVHLIGSDIVADEDNTTFVNSLRILDIPTSSKGLKKGKLWNDAGTVKIV